MQGRGGRKYAVCSPSHIPFLVLYRNYFFVFFVFVDTFHLYRFSFELCFVLLFSLFRFSSSDIDIPFDEKLETRKHIYYCWSYISFVFGRMPSYDIYLVHTQATMSLNSAFFCFVITKLCDCINTHTHTHCIPTA